MDTKAESIDRAAGGLLRHRFLRAVGGALMVATVLALLVAALIFAAPQAPQWLYNLTGIEVDGADMLVLFPMAAVCAGLLVAAFFQLPPRIGPFWAAGQADYAAHNWRRVAIRTLIALGIVGVLVGSVVAVVVGGGLATALIALTAVIAAGLTIVIVIATLIVGAIVALLQGLYFRIWGLVGVAAFLAALAAGGYFILYIAFGIASGFSNTTKLPLLAVGLAGVVLGGEFAWQSVWQLFSSKHAFYGARGWRPPIHRVVSITRRHMGMPGFLANVKRERWRLTLLYFGVAASNAVIIGGIVWPICSIGFGHDLWLVLLNCALGWSASYGAFKLGMILSRRAEARVTQVYQAVREWDQRAPVVFLRSFNQDDARLKPHSIDPLIKWMAGVARPQTLDEILLEHASPYGPVIAIGDPRTKTPPLGAARIFVHGEGNEWQGVVTGLVAASSVVVMCPTSTEGVRWELDLLQRQDFYARAIYLANPELTEAESLALFEEMSPPGFALILPKKKTPIAAFHDPKLGWRVLCARRRSLQTYTVALNIALHALLGVKGAPAPKRPKKEKKAKSAKKQKRAKTAPAAQPETVAV